MSSASPSYDPRYLAGVVLFNRQDYFEAHEAWEDLWAEAHGQERKFYQGLIQAAVGLCHYCNGNLNGAIKLYHSSRGYMEGCLSGGRAEGQAPFLGLDLVDFWQQMEACFHDLLEGQQTEIDAERLPVLRLEPAPESWPDPAEFIQE